jgi:hypothetical protein
MLYLLAFMYLFGAFVVHKNYSETGQVTISDVLMFVASPFSMVTVLLVRVVSTFVDLDKVILGK